MTRIKMCGLSRPEDIEAANELKPEYIGFVFAEKSRRYVTPEKAAGLKRRLSPDIQTVGVFVNAELSLIRELVDRDVIDMIQLHGDEDDAYIREVRSFTDKPVIRAFRVTDAEDIEEAERSTADLILLDSGAGTGAVFDWKLAGQIRRPFFLAGGLDPENVEEAVRKLNPYAVDVSSGIETDGLKDRAKMAAFADAARNFPPPAAEYAARKDRSKKPH